MNDLPFGPTQDSGTPKPRRRDGDGKAKDILVLMEGTEASQALVNALAQPLIDGEIASVEARSDEGREIMERVPGDVSVPLHVVEEDGSYRVGDLSELVKRYAGTQP